MKHKSDDYKISAVKYYLKNKDNIRKTCKIFDCSKISLQRCIDRYKTTKNITRKNRTPISYKINKDQVKTAVNMIDKNEQLTMDELLFSIYIYMFVSLSASYAGNACAVRQSIIKYTTNSNETQFFDWLVTSMKSVNQILENTPIIFESNYIYPNPSNTTSINFKNFDLLTSHHDIHELNDNSINEITEKYIRRKERLIKTIKEQNKINFIRYCKNQQNIEEEEILKFYKNIKNINTNLLFNFILISDNNDLVIPNSLLKDNFIYINLNNYIDDDILNETNTYFKIIKTYKCIFDLVK